MGVSSKLEGALFYARMDIKGRGKFPGASFGGGKIKPCGILS